MNWTGGNQSFVDLDSNTTHSNPGPLYSVVAGFPRHVDRVESLPLVEIMRLRVITDFIVGSFESGCLPITGIHFIGHADTDQQRGRLFEQQISESRARNVQAYLKKEVASNVGFSPFQLPPGTPTAATIDWKTAKGLGATKPDPENTRRKKTPANMNEEDRKRNRRVEIILEPGLTAIPDPVSQQSTTPPGPGVILPPPGWGGPIIIPPAPGQTPRNWLEDHLKRDPILKLLPPDLREKAIGALKNVDEVAADKVIDALPLDPKFKGVLQTTVKGLLKMFKGEKFQVPVPQPPQYEQPPSRVPEMPKAPGETIFTLPPIKW